MRPQAAILQFCELQVFNLRPICRKFQENFLQKIFLIFSGPGFFLRKIQISTYAATGRFLQIFDLLCTSLRSKTAFWRLKSPNMYFFAKGENFGAGGALLWFVAVEDRIQAHKVRNFDSSAKLSFAKGAQQASTRPKILPSAEKYIQGDFVAKFAANWPHMYYCDRRSHQRSMVASFAIF